MRRMFLTLAIPTLVLAALLPRAAAQEQTKDANAQLLADVGALLSSADTYAVAERIQRDGTTAEVVRRYGAVVEHLYWKAKNLPGCLAVGRAGLLYGLTQSRAVDDPQVRRQLRVSAQELSFNLASYGWPGWEEKGIEIGPSELAEALDAARLDLRLVREMEYPPTKHANAHWIVGAQLLAAGLHAEARAEFEASSAMAAKAKAPEKDWMARGFAAIATALEKPNDEAGRAQLAEARKELLAIGSDDAKYYATQLDDVLRIFARK